MGRYGGERKEIGMKHEVRVIVHPINRVITTLPGINLLDLLRQEGIQIESICGGKGECGKCRVIIHKGEFTKRRNPEGHTCRHIMPAEYHLACVISVTGDLEITIPVESRIDTPQILMETQVVDAEIDPSIRYYSVQVAYPERHLLSGSSVRLTGYSDPRPIIASSVRERISCADTGASALLTYSSGYPEIIDIIPGGASPMCYGAAVDLGTTTIVGVLVDLSTGQTLSREVSLNTQITYGEELITRIAYARKPEGLQTLQRLAVESINCVLHHLVTRAGIRRTEIHDICIGGNTVMIHLLTGTDPSPLEMVNADVSRKPFIRKAASLGMDTHQEAYCYCLPNVSRFVGGDAVGDVMSSTLHTRQDLSLLIDLGTNGEILVGNREWIASVSCASGPAFEGAGIGAGMRAMRGAIEHLTIDPGSGTVSLQVIGDVLPRGICGSGLIDAAAEMFRSGIIDFKGKIRESAHLVRLGPDGPECVLVPAEKTSTGRDIVITQSDMDYLMDSKAALCGGIGVLMKKFRLSVPDIRHLYLAGAFGAFTNIQNAVALGIIPAFPNAAIHPIGNGSLTGAYLALLSKKQRQEAQVIAGMMIYIDLLVDPDFTEEYSAALSIPGKKDFFPDAHLPLVHDR
jgi:uncharacterized 2Fe-2S/4Fe-4S cluster protein (DUF4445 family)